MALDSLVVEELITKAIKAQESADIWSWQNLIVPVVIGLLVPFAARYLRMVITTEIGSFGVRLQTIEAGVKAVQETIESNKKNSTFLEELRAIKSIHLDKFKTLSIRNVAEIRGEELISITSKILFGYDLLNSRVWTQIQSSFNVAIGKSKSQIVFQLGQKLADLYWEEHELLLSKFMSDLEELITDPNPNKLERFTQTSYEYLVAMLMEIETFEANIANKMGSWEK